MFKKRIFGFLVVFVFLAQFVRAQDPYIGEIRMFAGTFAPYGWMFCQGQTLQIAQNAALFAVLGTTYGGNGTTTFALPDLRGRVPVGFSNTISLGSTGGQSTTSLTVSNLPAHNHSISASTAAGATNVPTNAVMANSSTLDKEFAGVSDTNMTPTGTTGSNVPIDNMQPYIGINFIIAFQGIFPQQ